MVMVFLMLIPAAPASAATNLNVNITSPGANTTSTTSTVSISGDAAIDQNSLGLTTNTITGVSIGVHGAGTAACSGCGATSGQPTAHFSYSPFLSYNGPYTADVSVDGQESSILGTTPHHQSATINFKVGAAPAAPRSVSTVANGDRSVTVTWRANSEPDIIGYQVQGSDGSKSNLIKPGSTLAWTDTATTQTGGRYTYAVYVARNGADGASGTPIATASGVVGADVPAPPPPSTTADGSLPPLIQSTPTSIGGAGSNAAAPSLDLSGFLSKTAGASPPPKLVTPGAKLGTPEVPAPDTGFQPTLPFPLTAGRGGKAVTGTPGALGGAQPAGSSSSTKRTILLPFAAGLFLCVVGIHVRWFNKRIGGDGSDPSLLPVEDVPTGGSDIAPAPAPAPRPAGVLFGARRPTPAAGDEVLAPLDDEDVLVTW